MLSAGSLIPPFHLPSTLASVTSSEDLKNKFFVLFLYPRDNTPGCTTETSDFVRLYPEFKKLDCEVCAMNHNSMKSHEKFCEKLQIPFALFSDESTEFLQKLGVWQMKKFMGKESMGIVRTTFLVSTGLKIEKIWRNVKVNEHADQVLGFLKTLRGL